MEFTYTPMPLIALKGDIDLIKQELDVALSGAEPFISKDLLDQMEFYIEGLFYHFDHVYTYYAAVTVDIFEKITIINRDELGKIVKVELKPEIEEVPDVIVFDSNHLRYLMFEAYSFILIAKIMLDKINFFVGRFFRTSLPNSISKFVELTKHSTCPIHTAMQEDPLRSYFFYLIQLRDYLTHNKPFVAANRGYAVAEGHELSAREQELLGTWVHHPIAINFTIMGTGIKVNIFLPDQILDEEHHVVQEFTYETRFNLLSFIGSITRYCYLLYLGILNISAEEHQEPYDIFNGQK